MFPAIFNINSINGQNGFIINGNNNYGAFLINSAGDINGDGIDDVVIGVPEALNGAGQSYVIFGSKVAFPNPFNLSSLNGQGSGFIINGVKNDVLNPPYGDNSGSLVGAAGDINGDGIDDIIINAPFASNDGLNYGQNYVIYGNKNGFPNPFNLTSLNGKNGFIINNNVGASSSASISTAGDVNGDGVDDVIIGCADTMTFYLGQASVIFGNKNGFVNPFNLASLNGSNGFIFDAISEDNRPGSSVSGAGDVNGDGLDDILIGAIVSDGTSGAVYVIYGSKQGFNSPLNVTSLNGNNGFVITGDYGLGFTISGGGDVNNDGLDDIILGDYSDLNGAGQTYVVYGSRNGFSNPFNITSLNGQNGFVINGINSGDGAGDTVGIGDINGDSIDDIIIDAPGANNFTGQGYIVYGSKNGFPNPFNLSSLNGTNGFTINGVINSNGINSIEIIENIGDINGDNIDDLGITAASIPNNVLAQSYVVYGQGSITPTTTPIPSSIPSPGPHNSPESNADIGAIVGGTVGGVVFLGLTGLALWYGKTHGWCSGEHSHGGDYTAV